MFPFLDTAFWYDRCLDGTVARAHGNGASLGPFIAQSGGEHGFDKLSGESENGHGIRSFFALVPDRDWKGCKEALGFNKA